MLKKFIGNKQFYKMVALIVLPIVVQNGITTFVGLLDNIMVGAIGTEQMSGVSIVNQLVFVYNLCIFGGLSGAGIFTAQYFGKRDEQGIRYCIRIKVLICIIATAIAALIFVFFGGALISRFLNEGSETGDLQLTFDCAQQYLSVILWTLAPYTITQLYASTLRETGETVLPMKAGIVALIINGVLNYVFIFGVFGLPAMGVTGAAYATLVARVVECLIVVVWTHRNKVKNPFFVGAYKSLYVPKAVLKRIAIKGTPLLLNETIWAVAMTLLLECYSFRGLAAVAAMNISNTVNNLFSIVFMSIGNAIAIIVGKMLGAGDLAGAKDADNKMIALSFTSCFLLGVIMAACAPLIVLVYNTTDEVRTLATHFIMIVAAFMPVHALMHSTYFTLRSGGRTVITFLFDSAFAICISVPLAYVLTHYTALPTELCYALVLSIEIIKCVIGIVLLRKNVWLKNIVEDKPNEAVEKANDAAA